MPLKRCQTDDQPGWKWGDEGKCFPYTPGNEESETAARKKALAQAAAMGEFPGTGDTNRSGSEAVENRAEQGNITTPDAGDLNTDARRYCADHGWAMRDGSYPIRPLDMHGRTDLTKAIRAVGRGSGSHEAIRRHIIKRARALGLTDMIPDDWGAGGGRSNSADGVEILTRSSGPVLEDVNFKQRIVDVIAVPWDQEAQIVWRNEVWRERFDRHAFDEAVQNSVRIPVNREHTPGYTIGRIVAMNPGDPRGLLASVKVARTQRGDDTLQLAAEGMLGGSVGYFVRKASDVLLDRRTMLRRVQRAFLEHFSMVESPAYAGAETVSVRHELTVDPVAGKQPLITPSLNEWMIDDVLSWANARFNK